MNDLSLPASSSQRQAQSALAPATQANVDYALKRAGNYRVKQAQTVGFEGAPDEFSGALLLAIACRETWVQNVVGGGYFDDANHWHSTGADHGAFQINSAVHSDFLGSVAGCKSGTWTPVEGHTALEAGYVPQFTTGARFAVSILRANIAAAKDRKVPDPVSFAVAAYNAGIGGAWAGWRDHRDYDYNTSGQDYSRWVLACKSLVNHFLAQHSDWKVNP